MRKPLAALAALSLLALPALAAEDTIYSGIDAWNTPSDGTSYADFYLEPIPAGFFCEGSKPWSGRIAFGGEPLETLPEGALGNSDTVLLRLDDASFNERGVATTRLQMQAMNLVGLEPVKTACGEYTVRSVLDGEQPVTNMQIIRTSAKDGHFLAPVAVNVRLIFTPSNGRGQTVELTQEIVFSPNPDARWTSGPVTDAVHRTTGLVLDSDGDGVADLAVPGTSNFTTGLSSGMRLSECELTARLQLIGPGEQQFCEGPPPVIHSAPTHVHNVQTGLIVYHDGPTVPYNEP